VADVAFRWGFGHLGRFAEKYRERYGELPSETLKSP
jgi:AraC-like DNA-binding protein